MTDPLLVQKMIEIIVEELKSQHKGTEHIFRFREEDWMVDGWLDIASLATTIVEHVR